MELSCLILIRDTGFVRLKNVVKDESPSLQRVDGYVAVIEIDPQDVHVLCDSKNAL